MGLVTFGGFSHLGHPAERAHLDPENTMNTGNHLREQNQGLSLKLYSINRAGHSGYFQLLPRIVPLLWNNHCCIFPGLPFLSFIVVVPLLLCLICTDTEDSICFMFLDHEKPHPNVTGLCITRHPGFELM